MSRLFFSLIILGVIASTVSATPKQVARFLSVMEEMPLMPGLEEVMDSAVTFDGPSGRIIEAFAAGSVRGEDVLMFYEAILPQLGWIRQANGKYRRDAEILFIEVSPTLAGTTGASAQFVLRPAKGQ
tara:strand:+ start:157 stop:537 length:381 start_codon:yes stop_codon:yes gene_type:complete